MKRKAPLYVTKSFLPPKQEFLEYVDGIWNSAQLTNQGPLVCELEKKLAQILDAPFFSAVGNGTLALQMLLRLFDIHGCEVITTPFSYVATTSAILWEHAVPVYADIEPECFSIDPEKVEALITPRTKAILATHVFGSACDIDKLAEIAAAHRLPLIFDAAHAFGCRWKGKALAAWGDGAALSFHATKLFHTGEGGGCILQNTELNDKLNYQRRFGHCGDEHLYLGINAKMNELNAAVGLCNLRHVAGNIAKRRKISECYDALLPDWCRKRKKQEFLEYNYAYYPVVFESEVQLLRSLEALGKENIFPRRYFYPSLNLLPYLERKYSCPVSEAITLKIACLPLSAAMEERDVEEIAAIIKKSGESYA